MEADVSDTEAEESSGGAPSEDLPAWLSGLEADEEEEQQPAPADDDLPEWLRAAGEEQEPAEPEPTAPTDWQPVDTGDPVQPEEEEPAAHEPVPTPKAEEQPAPTPATPVPVETKPEPEQEPEPPAAAPSERKAYQEPVTRSRSGMTGMLSAAQDPLLVEAQNELTRGNLSSAMEHYGKLIKRGKMLEEIIFDLREAQYRYPVEVSIMQTLGDAYMRANRLQEALDSYTKAEELLR
jgi:hypothetical protein